MTSAGRLFVDLEQETGGRGQKGGSAGGTGWSKGGSQGGAVSPTFINYSEYESGGLGVQSKHAS